MGKNMEDRKGLAEEGGCCEEAAGCPSYTNEEVLFETLQSQQAKIARMSSIWILIANAKEMIAL